MTQILSTLLYYSFLLIVALVLLYIIYSQVAEYNRVLERIVNATNPVVIYVDTSIPGNTIISVAHAG